MITIVESVDAHHAYYVRVKIIGLQSAGYEVTSIVRTEKMRLGFFGTDVTEVHYGEPNAKEVIT